VIPTHSPLVAHDVASTTFDAVLILEFHFLQALVAEVVALCWATPNTHHVGTVVTLAGFNNDVGMFMLINIVSNQAKAILDIVCEKTQFD